jgi:hypothetical protein
MAGGGRKLTVEELEERFRAAKDVIERSHYQTIWLLVVSRIWWKLPGDVLRGCEGFASQAARSSLIGSIG